ncbi:MAG TPA: FISUMP domain-containing protein [Mucilaginibacter sp.]|jgi:uncharacterized protein (TIGR02145 family)|nr:FISUMP domain-containing protein [Mucilaginibacter sp.]
MKKLSILVLIGVSIFVSCTKKNSDPVPNPGKNGADTSVTITGMTYPVVQIGSQTWTAVNYNGPGGIFNTGNVIENAQDGKLYTPLEASQIILPKGWRIPTYDDYLTLLITRGATKNSDGSFSANVAVAESLMDNIGWSEGNGNNYSKFRALPTGFYHLEQYYGTGNGASFLHSFAPGTPPDEAFTIGPGPDGNPFIFLGINLLDEDRCSIRFVKDN